MIAAREHDGFAFGNVEVRQSHLGEQLTEDSRRSFPASEPPFALDHVPVPPSCPDPLGEPLLHQVPNDPLRRAFGDVELLCDVADPAIRTSGDGSQGQTVG